MVIIITTQHARICVLIMLTMLSTSNHANYLSPMNYSSSDVLVSPVKAVDDPFPKHVWLVAFSCAMLCVVLEGGCS